MLSNKTLNILKTFIMSITNKVSDMIYSLKEDMKDSTFKKLMDKLKDINIQEKKTTIVKFELTYIHMELVIRTEPNDDDDINHQDIYFRRKMCGTKVKYIKGYVNITDFNKAQESLKKSFLKCNVHRGAINSYYIFKCLGLNPDTYAIKTNTLRINFKEDKIVLHELEGIDDIKDIIYPSSLSTIIGLQRIYDN